MFKKKSEVNVEKSDIQEELRGLFNSANMNLELDFEPFRRRVQSKILRKTIEIQAEKKRRNEVILLAVGYGVVIILTPLLILDYWVNGWCGKTVATLFYIVVFALLMVSCSPLLVKFKKKTH